MLDVAEGLRKQRRGKGAGSSSRSAALASPVGKSTLSLALFRPASIETAPSVVLRTRRSLPPTCATSSTSIYSLVCFFSVFNYSDFSIDNVYNAHFSR